MQPDEPEVKQEMQRPALQAPEQHWELSVQPAPVEAQPGWHAPPVQVPEEHWPGEVQAAPAGSDWTQPCEKGSHSRPEQQLPCPLPLQENPFCGRQETQRWKFAVPSPRLQSPPQHWEFALQEAYWLALLMQERHW